MAEYLVFFTSSTLSIFLLATLLLNFICFFRMRKASGDRRTAVCVVLTFAAASDSLMVVCGVPFTIKNILFNGDSFEQNSDVRTNDTTNIVAQNDAVNLIKSSTTLGCLAVLFRTSSVLFHGFYQLYRITMIVSPALAQNVFSWTTSVLTVPGKLN